MFNKMMLMALLCVAGTSGLRAAETPAEWKVTAQRMALTAGKGVGFFALTVVSLRAVLELINRGPGQTDTGNIACIVGMVCGVGLSWLGLKGFMRSAKDLFGTPDLPNQHVHSGAVNITVNGQQG